MTSILYYHDVLKRVLIASPNNMQAIQVDQISLLEECRLLERALEELHQIDPKIVDKGGYNKEEKAAIHQRYLFHTVEKVS
ncbi:hypothetical protein RIF29_14643 [Crotalaria pallida]|uniref:Uncharacterized protein n=1 Tax=Crotalaria pallida TaxID=3830 RepID=A0AAN9FC01_CROPI